MLEKTGRQRGTISTLFIIVLFMLFVVSMFFTVLAGVKVYENTDGRAEANYYSNTALGYIANKIRQQDVDDMVDVITVDGTQVLQLTRHINDADYWTWIYYYDGQICELFTRAESGLGLSDGLPVMESEGLVLEKEGNLLHLETTGENHGSMMLSLRSGRVIHEK